MEMQLQQEKENVLKEKGNIVIILKEKEWQEAELGLEAKIVKWTKPRAPLNYKGTHFKVDCKDVSFLRVKASTFSMWRKRKCLG